MGSLVWDMMKDLETLHSIYHIIDSWDIRDTFAKGPLEKLFHETISYNIFHSHMRGSHKDNFHM